MNGKSREPVELSLECSFSKRQPIRIDPSTAWDCSSFSCDKVINLCGFVICNKVDEDIEVSVGLRRIYQKIQHTKLLLENETKIIFDNPIRVPANEQCFIAIASKTFQQSSVGWFGFKTVKNVLQRDVSFQFQEDFCDSINLITCLLYNTID